MPGKNKYSNGLEDEKGAALIGSLFAILLATLLGFALYYSAVVSQAIAINDRDNTEAFYLADAGISHAVTLINKVPKSNYSDVLKAGSNSLPDTGDELSAPPTSGLWTTAQSIPAGNKTSGGVTGIGAGGAGRYWVSVKNDTASGETSNTDTNGILIITSTGVGRNGATATVEATIKTTDTAGMPGFLADGDVKITNTVKILGPGGTMQVNGDLNTAGNICAEDQFLIGASSVSNVSKMSTGPLCSVAAVSGSTALPSQPRVIPDIIDAAKLRSSFRSQADFVFKGNGAIYRQIGGVLGTFALTATELNSLGLSAWTWSSSSKTWSYSSSTILTDGTYYFEDSNMKITNGGSSVTPPKITLLSEGSISITNGPTFQPNLPGYSLVSANDISITSTLGSTGNPGLVYAYGQIEFTNKTDIYGGVIAANFYQPDGTNGADVDDVGGQNLVSRASKGTVRFSNVVNIITVGTGGTSVGCTVVSWREVRN